MTGEHRQEGIPGGLPSPDTLDWEHASLLSAIGAYGLIYRVAPGVVAKVGLIEPEEVGRQQYLAERGKALPVLGYGENLPIPEHIARTFCARHGRRSLPEELVSCCCGHRLSVLLMPEADTAIWEHFDALTIAEFMEEVSTACFEELEYTWDEGERNVAVYEGHLVALDLGDQEAPCW